MSGGKADKRGKDMESMVWAEVNLEVFPIFRFISTKRDSTPYSYETVVSTTDGAELRKTIKVVPSGEYGAPGVREMDVVVAVFELVQKRGGMPTDGKVETSRSELLGILGWTDSGTNFEDLKECLLRIRHTTIESRDAFYSKETESYITDGFEILRTVRFEENKRRADGRTNVRIVIRFHELVIRSFVAQYLKGLDPVFYRGLRRGLSKRLYRLVDQMRGEQRHWSVDLFELQRVLPIGPYRYPSQVKGKIDPPAQELKDKGFIEDFWYEDGDVHYLVSQKFARRRAAFELAHGPDAFVAMDMLLAHDLEVEEARKLVSSSGPRRCIACVQAMPFQPKKVRSSKGWLRWAIPNEEFDPYVFLKGDGNPTDVVPAEARELEDVDADEDMDGSDEPAEFAPHAQATRLWAEVLDRSADAIDVSSMRVWFEDVRAVDLDTGSLTVAVPSDFAQEYIATRFKDALESELKPLLSPEAELRIVVGRVVEERG